MCHRLMVVIIHDFFATDPYSVLGPDEIQIKSSRRNLVNEDGTLTDIIIGDVLVRYFSRSYRFLSDSRGSQITRNPCKVPTDVRKVNRPL